jgi:hypothetical protein
MFIYYLPHGVIRFEPTYLEHGINAMSEHFNDYEYTKGEYIQVDLDTKNSITQAYLSMLENDPEIDYPADSTQ